MGYLYRRPPYLNDFMPEDWDKLPRPILIDANLPNKTRYGGRELCELDDHHLAISTPRRQADPRMRERNHETCEIDPLPHAYPPP